jgi:biopolymer transport protein ExbD
MLRSKRALPLVLFAVLAGCRPGARSSGATADPAADAIPDAGPAIVVVIAGDGSTATVDGKSARIDELVSAFKATSAELPVRFEAAASASWGTVVRAVDNMKMTGRGGHGISLAVSGDRTRRTEPFFLPKAVASSTGGIGILAPDGRTIDTYHSLAITKDGAFMLDGVNVAGPIASALAGLHDLRNGALMIEGDTNAPFGAIVDAVALAQKNGAIPFFGVRPAVIPAEGR